MSKEELLRFTVWHTKDTAANMSCSKTFFLVNSVYTNNVLNAGVHV